MHKLKKLILCTAVLMLCACAITGNNSTIQQSPNDDNEYRYLRLDNGLQVMLVSDKSASQSAAALDVYVGSAQNPKEREGLAHFLEHMLFLGTKKYPNAGEYQAFIKANGGSHNAYTSFEHTSYFFDISTQAFPEALDRFAQFFIAPLFDVDYVKRETQAVNAEYFASLRDDARRSLDVFRQQVNPKHPFSRFAVGNSETLQDRKSDPIVQALKTFYQQYYSADVMTLAVLSPHTLDEMQTWVEQGFAKIKTHDTPQLRISEPLFNKGQLPLWLTIKPIKKQRKLSLLFPLPALDLTQQKYLDVIAYVLGDESAGSLLSHLKQNGWATSLSAGASLSYRGGDNFMLNIELTESGLKDQQKVLGAVFTAVNQLQQQGVSQALYKQIAQIRKLEFKFLPQKTAQQQVMHISSNLHHYSAQNVLAGAYEYPKYKAKAIDQLAAYLQPDNVYIVSFDPQLYSKAKTALYRVPFIKTKPSIELQNSWQEAANSAIQLPKLNPFVPQNTDLVALSSDSTEPVLLDNTSAFELWYQPLSEFLVPKQVTYIGLEYAEAHHSVENTALMSLYAAYLQEAMNESLYAASVAGLHASIYANARGLVFKFAGYSDKQAVLLKQVIEHIQTTPIDSVVFAMTKKRMSKAWDNALKQKPFRRLLMHLHEYIYQNSWPKTELVAALDKIDEQKLQYFQSRLFQDATATVFVAGNIEPVKVNTFAEPIKVLMADGNQQRPKIKVAKLSTEKLYQPVLMEHKDSAYNLYWQAENNSAKQQVLWQLLSNILEPAFFDRLRTQQQFGYVVFAQYYRLLDIPGMVFVVQSPHASVEQLDKAVNAFLEQQVSRLGWLSEAQLEKYKTVLAEDLNRPAKTLSEQAGRYWYNLIVHRKMQQKPVEQINALDALSLDDWKAFVKTLQSDKKRLLLLTTKPKNSEGLPAAGTWIDAIPEQQYIYP